MKIQLSCIAMAIVLSGCSKSVLDNEDVRCPFVDRGGCQSMQAISAMIDQNQFTEDGSYVKQAIQIRRGVNNAD